MATVRSSQSPNRISVRSIPGLTAEDVSELQAVGLGSLGLILDEISARPGDWQVQVSTGNIVISDEQAVRIERAVYHHPATPQAYKDHFEDPGELEGTAEESPIVVTEAEPEPAPRREPWYNRGLFGWLTGR